MITQNVIRLSKLFLWPEPGRFQAYPEFLRSVDPNEKYLHMADLARKAGGHRMLDNRHVKFENIVRNLPGLEHNKLSEPVIRGIGIFRKEDGGYSLSSWGKQLREEYLSDLTGIGWKITLAKLILLGEPRIRVIIKVLSNTDGILSLPQNGFFTGSYRQAVLVSEGNMYRPFVDIKSSPDNIQNLLNEHGTWALGMWQKELPESSFVSYEGVNKKQITIDNLSIAVKAAFILFRHLELVNEQGGQIKWNIEKASQLLGSELAVDFGWRADSNLNLLEVVNTLISRLKADNGFLVTSQLLSGLEQQGIEQPEKELVRLMDQGLIRLEAWDYGQSRHGRGLFGDPMKQLVKFWVHEGEM